MRAVRQLPDKFSAAPLPTSTVKQAVDLLALFIVKAFNRSLVRGHFTAAFKKTFITPTLQKPGMDTADVSLYRPISNLPVLSKLLERLVVRQLIDYLQSADLLPVNQSGFRPGHSTETAVLRVLSDILLAVDRGEVAAQILLGLSVAFDAVDYESLLQRLQSTYGISDVAHRWFMSYLLGRSQYVRNGTSCSSVIELICGVPQRSVIGLGLCSFCTLPATLV